MLSGRIGYRTRLAYEDSPGSATYTEIAKQRTMTPSDPVFDEVDTTNQDSPSFFKEYVLAMRDPGMVTFEGNFLPEDATHQRMRAIREAAVEINWRVNLRDAPTNSVIYTETFAGLLKSFSVGELSTQGIQTYRGSIKVTGAVVAVP